MPDPPALQRFARLARLPDGRIDLGEAALLIAAVEYPDLEVGLWLGRLDALGEEVRARVAGQDGDFERLAGLNAVLFGDHGLRGNRQCYYDLRNSFLNDVLERRLGIPISLAVVAIEVGRRAGVPLSGVGMPCHFLLRHARHPRLLVDPFDGGRVLAEADCRELLARVSGGSIRFRLELLRSVTPREILLRMLNNLRGIYLHRGQLGRAAAMVDFQRLLYPAEARLVRDHGLLLLRGGELQRGIGTLELYLAGEIDAADRAEVELAVAAARRQLLRLN